jgi:hypothetical protein
LAFRSALAKARSFSDEENQNEKLPDVPHSKTNPLFRCQKKLPSSSILIRFNSENRTQKIFHKITSNKIEIYANLMKFRKNGAFFSGI